MGRSEAEENLTLIDSSRLRDTTSTSRSLPLLMVKIHVLMIRAHASHQRLPDHIPPMMQISTPSVRRNICI